MVILGIFLVLLSLTKLIAIDTIRKNIDERIHYYFPADLECNKGIVYGILVFDGILGLLCGIYILL